MKFVYSVWFRDPEALADDQDYEWPACFAIDAADSGLAQSWGDQLAHRYAHSHRQEFLRSGVESYEGSGLPGLASLSVISEGEDASDQKLGW